MRAGVHWKAVPSGQERVGSLSRKGSVSPCQRVKERARGSNPSPGQPPPQCDGATPASGPATPEVEARASHDTLRGAYSNRTERREEVVMAAPEPEVLSSAAVSGKAWGPEVGDLFRPCCRTL